MQDHDRHSHPILRYVRKDYYPYVVLPQPIALLLRGPDLPPCPPEPEPPQMPERPTEPDIAMQVSRDGKRSLVLLIDIEIDEPWFLEGTAF
ncbi:hypothetical protein ACVWXE_002443 [Thermostichus sp. MS-CIW-41]